MWEAGWAKELVYSHRSFDGHVVGSFVSPTTTRPSSSSMWMPEARLLSTHPATFPPYFLRLVERYTQQRALCHHSFGPFRGMVGAMELIAKGPMIRRTVVGWQDAETLDMDGRTKQRISVFVTALESLGDGERCGSKKASVRRGSNSAAALGILQAADAPG